MSRAATLAAGVLWLGVVPGAGAAMLAAHVMDGDGQPLPDAVVVLARADGEAPPYAPPAATVDQVDKEFQPYVTAVAAGATVDFPNSDSVRHHVYSFSPAKTFELPLYAGTSAQPVVFDRPGVVTLGCNIHDWMIAYVYVADTPWFAKTDTAGTATVTAPAGDYRARVWHPHLAGDAAATARDLTLDDASTAELTWRLALKPALQPRRAPLPGQGGYR